ncbi:MAG TPA: O-antigen ligase family protein [Gemmatimonadaceae bacterium]|nr:O-antigen ligase family protein [Gemmatimonadaceae bacterium]
MTARALQLALLLLVIGNIGRIPIADSAGKQAPFLVNDFAVLAILVIASVEAMRRRALNIDWPGALAVLFAIVGFVSAVVAVPRFGLSGFELAFSLAYLLRWLAYFGVYIAAINLLRREDLPGLLGAFDAAVMIFAIFGIFQAAFLPGFAQLVYPESVVYADWDPQGHRLVSSFLDPNYAGALITIGLLLCAGRLASGERVPLWRVAVLLTALILTLSRGSMLACGIGLLIVLMIRGVSARVLKTAAILAILALPGIPRLITFAAAYNKLGLDASALLRFVEWSRALRVISDNPLFGVGFNTYGYVGRFYGFDARGTSAFALDGGLLFIAVMTGVVGVTLYAGMLGLVMARARAVWRDAAASAQERGVSIAVAAVTVAMVVHSLFVNSLLLPFLMEPLWLLWAIPFVIRRRAVDPRALELRDETRPHVAVVSFPRAA